MAKKEKGFTEDTQEMTAGQKKRAAKKANLINVIGYIEANADMIPEDVLASAKALKPGQRVSKVGVAEVISNLFVVTGAQVSEQELWENHRLGRAEMRKITNNLIKKPLDPEDRKWVRFDSESGVYELMGTGSNPPAGWTGYVPAVIDAEIL